jgi:hypothetical protein
MVVEVDTILHLTRCFINFPFKPEHDRTSCPVALRLEANASQPSTIEALACIHELGR